MCCVEVKQCSVGVCGVCVCVCVCENVQVDDCVGQVLVLCPGCLHDPHMRCLLGTGEKSGDDEVDGGEIGTGVTAPLVGLGTIGRGQVRSLAASGQNCK